MTRQKHTVTLIPGDGIGPEVANATRRIIEAAGAQITWEVCEAGAEVFKKGLPSGVPAETIDSIQRNRVALKGPLETPVGYGEKSANVTLRKLFETFANIRPIRQFPNIPSPYAARPLDFVFVRENVEDLYAGIEHMQTPGVGQCLKLISRKGCEKIARLAFEFARSEGRKHVLCATKSNIMKMTEGLLKRTFEEVAKDYPDIQSDHMIVDNCAHQLVRRPEQFDVIVTTNMNGDILSDLGSALVGGLGFAPGANIGVDVAIFEAVHGSAPKYAGRNLINPTAVLLSGVMMLRHLQEFEVANAIEHALYKTFEGGKHMTRDVIGNEGSVSTTAFTDAIIANLGQTSDHFTPRDHKPLRVIAGDPRPDVVHAHDRRVIGLDVFVESGLMPSALGELVTELCADSAFSLKMISNRGVKVFPSVGVMPDVVDQYRCRLMLRNTEGSATEADVMDALHRISTRLSWAHIEKLQLFDGQPAFTKAQGED